MIRTGRMLGIGLALVLASAALMLSLRLILPAESVARGWLVAFAFWSSVPIGSLTLLQIHRLTGGEWGRAAAPVLRPAAGLAPLAALAFLPILLALPLVYPWAADAGAIPPDVARWYLNGPSFAGRALIALGIWSLLGLLFAAGSGNRLVAALGLAFFGLAISLVSVDWFLSVEPRYVASAFGATVAIGQILAALAVAALVGAPDLDGEAAGDLGGLLVASLLGVVYLELMTFVVAWYGDLPDKAAWFVKRGTPAWIAAVVTALVLGALLPFGILLVRAARRSRLGLRIAGGLILAGSALHAAWLIVPAFDGQGRIVGVACIGIVALVLASLAIGAALRPPPEPRHVG